MARASGAGGALRDFLAVSLDPGDQFFEIVWRQPTLADHEIRALRDQRDWLKILQRVVIERIHRAIDDMCAPVPEAQHIAVGRGPRDAAVRDAAGGSAIVLDHECLADGGAHALGDDASDGIGRPAGRCADDDRNRLRRKGLRPRNARHRGQGGSARGQTKKISAGKFLIRHVRALLDQCSQGVNMQRR
jgi:hypothetical protein